MSARVFCHFLSLGLLLLVTGCGFFERPERPAWRAQAENLCLSRKLVQPSPAMSPLPPINGPGICGLDHPFRIVSLLDGSVRLNAPQTIGCPMIAATEEWLARSVQPIAYERLGSLVVQVNSMGSLACRPIDHQRGARLSEHSFGNALDVGGFILADGREIIIRRDWNSDDPQLRAFLREIQAGACGLFTTILAPGSDMFHYDHIHLDLAMHGNTSTGPRRICKPAPDPRLLPSPPVRDNLPDPPMLEEDLDIAGYRPAGSDPSAMRGLSAAIPPPPERLAFTPRPLPRPSRP